MVEFTFSCVGIILRACKYNRANIFAAAVKSCKVTHLQKSSESVKVSSNSTCAAIKEQSISEDTVQLSQTDIDNANKILKGAGFLLKQKQKLFSDNNERLQQSREKIESQVS